MSKDPQVEVAIVENKPEGRGIDDLTYFEMQNLVTDYLAKVPSEDIADKYKVSARTVSAIINNNHITRTEIERQSILFPMLQESMRIAGIKEKLLSALELNIARMVEDPKKSAAYNDDLLNTGKFLDTIQRLDIDKPTEIKRSEIESKTVDYSDVLKDLKTEEDKRAFLLDLNSNKK